jgi:hypothetical protein
MARVSQHRQTILVCGAGTDPQNGYLMVTTLLPIISTIRLVVL